MHPFHHHREVHVGHRRVKTLMKSGGVAHHGDEAQDRALFKKMIAEHDRKEVKAHGHKAAKRYARGGRTKGHTTNIAIVVPHGGQRGAGPPPGPPAGPPGMQGAPPMPGGAPPPNMMMRPPGMKRGGRAPGGEPTEKNLKGWAGYASKHSYARGGGLPTAGAMSGEGRLQKAHKAR